MLKRARLSCLSTLRAAVGLALMAAAATATAAATAPLAVNDQITVDANAESTINVLANDVAVTGPLAIVAASTPGNGKVILANGRLRYLPNPGFAGIDTFTYTIRDGLGIGAVDRAPLASFGGVPVFGSGYGSALARVPGSTTDFYIMTDRGPNTAGTGSNKVFPVPSFAPQIARVTPNTGTGGGYHVVSTILFKRPAGAPANPFGANTLTGLPFTANPTTGIAVGAGGVAIPLNDDYGIDSEGLVALADGTFWVSDEYGPMMCHFAADGTELERITPTGINTPTLVDQSAHSLPQVLKKRIENKGMEGLTLTPDGTKLVGIMQSPLDNLTTGVADVKKGVANRIVVYDLATGKTQQYVYLLERTGSGTPNTTVSEIAAISNRKFLVDERDSKFPNDPAGAATFKKVFEIDLDGDPRLGGARIQATDVSDGVDNATDGAGGLLFNGGTKTLEDITYNKTTAQTTTDLIAAGVQPPFKREVLDLLVLNNGYAYNHDKVEGMAVLATTTDPTFGAVAARIALSNDDDFGVTDGPNNLPGAKLTPQGLVDYNEILILDLIKGGPGVAANYKNYKHVLVLTIDGFRDADLADPNLAADMPNMLALKAGGVTYTHAACNTPTDSFPTLLGIMTGASAKTMGVYYDDTYSRTLYPPTAVIAGVVPNTPAGAEAPWTEVASHNSAVLNGLTLNASPVPPLLASGYDASAIDVAHIPQLFTAGGGGVLTPVYPHNFLKVNTIFEVAHAAGMRTAWSDKHPSYEVLNGPSGLGLDDFFGAESEAKEIATAPTDRINGTFALTDSAAGKKASKSQDTSLGEDDLRVQAVLNQIQGKTAKGGAFDGNTVPALFGMNFLAVNSAQKFDTAVPPAGGSGIALDGTVSANLHEAFAHTDASIKRIVDALKATVDGDGHTLFDNTLIVLTAKHGNTPRLGQATVEPVDFFTAPLLAASTPIPVAHATQDAVSLLWLVDQSQTAAAVAVLQAMQSANPTLIDEVLYESASVHTLTAAGFGDPLVDDRSPDIVVKLNPNVIIASSQKRAEHGGFAADETHVALVLSGGIPTPARGTVQAAAVKTTQLAPTILSALGLNPADLQGAVADGTVALPNAPSSSADLATSTATVTVTVAAQSPYVIPIHSGVVTRPLFTVGDSVNLKPDGFTAYRMVGIPDGLGAFDNGDGTFTLLMNHELTNVDGIARAHGSIGAFVSKWIINKSTLQITTIQDLIPDAAHLFTWNGSAYVAGTTTFSRFCSADLAAASAFLNGGKGTTARFFMNGEEVAGGRAMAHTVTGTNAGTSYELPRLGKAAWENALANPYPQDKTILIEDEDQGLIAGAASGQVYVYIGTKQVTGTGPLEIDDAGLRNGQLYAISVTGFAAEDRASPFGGLVKGATKSFTLAILNTTGDVSTLSGDQLDAATDIAGGTRFLRPEDGCWDPSNPADFYFHTTGRIDDFKNGGDGAGTPVMGRSRVWKLHFADIANPENGGVLSLLVDGSEDPGPQMLDNMTIDRNGRMILCEDPGNFVAAAKVWCLNLATGSLTAIAKHDPTKFGDRVAGVTTPPTAPFTADEETSGVLDMGAILGNGWNLIVCQAHYPAGDTELVEGGQLLALYVPSNVGAGVGGTGLSGSTPYLNPTATGVQAKALITTGESVNLKPDGVTPYRMAGIPDGLGAFDNGDGTFTVLMNHEITSALGVQRAHGSIGAFVSKWVINKSTLQVQSGSDLIQSLNLWNGTVYATGTTAFNRFCSADLPAVSALYNAGSGKGTLNRIFMDGEEFSSTTGPSGRAMAHVVTGPDAGKSWDLPLLGHVAFENTLACPVAQDKTIVITDDDSGRAGAAPPSELNIYIGTKTTTGLDIDKAGLTNGLLYGLKVTGKTVEDLSTTAPYGLGAAKGVAVPFTLAQYTTTNLLTDNGVNLQAEAITNGVTQFSRIEDGAWDPVHPADYYFVTTDQFDQVKALVGTAIGRSRLWRVRFTDIVNPETGGTIAMMLDGTEPYQMLDNITIDTQGRILLCEDVGNNDHNGKVWVYSIANGSLTQIAKHDPARFGDLIGGVVTPATAPFTRDEETSGVLDVASILGSGWYLIDVQAHYATDAELVEGGQLLAIYVPSTVGTGSGGGGGGGGVGGSGTGPSASAPYLIPSKSGVQFKAVLTVGESVNLKPDGVTPYRMVGIPDGLGAFDNNDGTFTLLMNHEIVGGASPVGIARAHGSAGAFVSKWIINKSTLQVTSIQDLIPDAAHLFTWNGTSYVAGATSFSRFCSADLGAATAFLNGSKGTTARFFMNGEEVAGGRAMAHTVTGPNAGKSYELPRLGKAAWENSLANPTAQDKTIVIEDEDQGLIAGAASGQIYVYIGTKLVTGTGPLEIDDAGLNNGKLYAISVTGFPAEDRAAPFGGLTKGGSKPFTLAVLNTTGDVSTLTGDQLDAATVTAAGTRFLRPEDGCWDPSHPADFYFVTTDRIDDLKNGGSGAASPAVGRSRLWRLRFASITTPEGGGTLTMLIDGSEDPGPQMMDNITVDTKGRVIICEDPGDFPAAAKVWAYTIVNGRLDLIGKHDPAKFGDRIAGTTTSPTAPFTADEESSGVVDVSAILGADWFLIDVQAHYATDAELVEGGQLLAMQIPDSATTGGGATIPGTVPPTGNTKCGSSSAIAFLGLLAAWATLSLLRRRRLLGDHG